MRTFQKSLIFVCTLAIAGSMAGCSTGLKFGIEEKPNPWAMACAQSEVLTDAASSAASRTAATQQLESILEKYGTDGSGEAMRAIVGPVVAGALKGDYEPAKQYRAANC